MKVKLLITDTLKLRPTFLYITLRNHSSHLSVPGVAMLLKSCYCVCSFHSISISALKEFMSLHATVSQLHRRSIIGKPPANHPRHCIWHFFVNCTCNNVTIFGACRETSSCNHPSGTQSVRRQVWSSCFSRKIQEITESTNCSGVFHVSRLTAETGVSGKM